MKKLIAIVLASISTAAWAGPPAEGAPLKGQVIETMNSGGYTYLHLKTAGGDVWAAVVQAQVKTGAEVTVENPVLMTQFESKTLHRTFDEIYFGSLASGGAGGGSAGDPAAAAHAGMTAQAASVPVVKVAKAPGADGRTVAEVYAQKSTLKDKTVQVRGTVVKFTAGVMDRNWVHLRDGSGVASDGTNDLLVTTTQTTHAGDVVVVKGTVRTDVDFGAGYSYRVMVDNASLEN